MNTQVEKAPTGWKEKLPEEELKRRIARFKELIKQGKPIWKSLRESGLQPRYCKQYYDEIWGDPDMAGFKPKEARQREEYASAWRRKPSLNANLRSWRGRGKP